MTYRISRDDPLYAEIIEVVAEHPASDVDEIVELLDGEHNRDSVQEELRIAVERNDLTEADSKYWVTRHDGPPMSDTK